MQNDRKTIPDCLLAACLAFCMTVGLMGCFLSMIGREELMGHFFHGYFMLVFIYAILFSLVHIHVKVRMIGLPVMAALTCFLTAWNREEVLGSGADCLNHIVDLINRYYGTQLKTGLSEADHMSSGEMAAGVMVFFVILLFLLNMETGWFLNARRVFCLFAGLILFGLCVGKMPSGEYAFLCAAVSAACFSCSRNRDKGKRMHIKQVCQTSSDRHPLLEGRSVAALVTLAIFGAASGIGFLFVGYSGKALLTWHVPVQQWANEQEQKVLHFNFHNLFSNQGMVQAALGKLSNSSVTYTGQEIMVLTMKEPPTQPLYLRGFTGGSYGINEWKEADEGIFLEEAVQAIENFELESPWAPVKADGFHSTTKEDVARAIADMGYERAVSLTEHSFLIQSSDLSWSIAQTLPKKMNALQIEYKNAPGDYGYFPYFTKIIWRDQIRGGSSVLRRRNDAQEVLESINLAMCIEPWDYFKIESIQDARRVMEALPWSEQSFQQLEHRYRQYAQGVYTALPENGLDTLREFCIEHPQQEKDVTTFIQNYLSDFSYTLSPEPLPKEEDIAEFFLFSGKKGYCIHFATAAALLYRMYGVPARFVEGYVAWPEMFQETVNEDGTPVYRAVITDRQAHAWTEIYVDDVGFLPVDMTPASAIVETNTVRNDSDATDSPQENVQADMEDEKRGSEQEDQTDKGLKEKEQNALEQSEDRIEYGNGDGKENGGTTGSFHGKQSLFAIAGILCCAAACLLFGQAKKIRILYRQHIYKEHLAVISDERRKIPDTDRAAENPRAALCLAAAAVFEYIRLCDREENHWKKETRLLSRQEWNQWFGGGNGLAADDHTTFYNLAMRAIYASPQENFTVQDAVFGFDFLKKMRAILISRIPKENELYIEILDQTMMNDIDFSDIDRKVKRKKQ